MADSSSNRDLRPDLDETINVPEAHAALQDSIQAAGREKSLRENGMESVALWLGLVSAIIVLFAGAVMGQGGAFFGYGELTKDGYLRAPSPVPIPSEPLPIAAIDLLRKEGAKAYSACASCHQANGMGQTGVYPPLAGSEWVTGKTEKLAMIIHNGVKGDIEVAGATYSTQMDAIGKDFNAKTLAALMTYLRTSWGNDASIVTPEMAAEALKISRARGGGQTTADELLKNHDKMLPGEELAPDTLLDAETWEPFAPEQ